MEINAILMKCTGILCAYLHDVLSRVRKDYWQVYVLNQLSYNQLQLVESNKVTSLDSLDLAALLRLFDKNWFEMSALSPLPKEARNWLKEMQNLRNRYAHLGAVGLSIQDTLRDFDTIKRFSGVIQAPDGFIAQIDDMYTSLMQKYLKSQNKPVVADSVVEDNSQSLFKAGDLAALRSNPSVIVPILKVVTTGLECRYVYQTKLNLTFHLSYRKCKEPSWCKRVCSPRRFYT